MKLSNLRSDLKVSCCPEVSWDKLAPGRLQGKRYGGRHTVLVDGEISFLQTVSRHLAASRVSPVDM